MFTRESKPPSEPLYHPLSSRLCDDAFVFAEARDRLRCHFRRKLSSRPLSSAGEYLQPLVSAENELLPLELLACEKKAPDKN